MRGFLSGLVVGSVVMALGLGLLSQLAPLPSPARPDPVEESTAPAEAGPDGPEEMAEAPAVSPPAVAVPAPVPEALAPPPVVVTEEAGPALAPEASASAPVVVTEAPASPRRPAPAPPATMREEPSRPAVSDPAALPQAGAGADTLPEAAEPPPMVEEEEALPGEVPAHSPLAPAPEEEASSTPAEPTAPTEPLLDSPAPDLPETAVPEAASPGTVAPVPDLSGPGDTAPATARTDPGAGAADQGTDTGPRHSVEIAAPPADPVTPTEPAPAELAPADPAPIVDSRPLARFAVPFDNPEGKPLFAIVLADDGGTGIDRAALAALPLPVTIALDPGAPGAAQFAVVYRNAGKEVAMLATGIPEGVKPADLEAILAAHAAVLPEAVAVVDLPDGGFQTDLARAAALMPLLKAQGRGLVTFDRGLNVGDQVARREAVPAALIFRQIDAEEESVPVMRRYLDRAVFKAAQDGHAVVFGAASPEVITALLEWSVEGRAGSVALAPLTALLSVPK